MTNFNDTWLYHYGVLGMKWGHHKYVENGVATKKGEKKFAKITKKEEKFKQKIKKQNYKVTRLTSSKNEAEGNRNAMIIKKNKLDRDIAVNNFFTNRGLRKAQDKSLYLNSDIKKANEYILKLDGQIKSRTSKILSYNAKIQKLDKRMTKLGLAYLKDKGINV